MIYFWIKTKKLNNLLSFNLLVGEKIGKPGKRPKPTMNQVIETRQRNANENMRRRIEKLEKIVGKLEPPQATFLLHGPKHLAPFVGANNVKPEHL